MIADNNNLPELPKGWTWTSLGEIRLEKRQTISPKSQPKKAFELYSVPSFERQRPETVFGEDIGSSKQIVEEDTVLLCKINPRINRVWVVGNYTDFPKIASTEWIPFGKLGSVFPKYLCYFMRNNSFRDFLASNVSGVGGSLMRIKPNTFVEYPFPLSPLNEQHRIVAKFEELFTKLDAGVEALKKIKAELKRYRQAVLKYAFEGKLTEKWRQAHKSELEPASKLLERIIKEREKTTKGKAKKLPPLDKTNLPELPEGWEWTRVGDISKMIQYGTSEKAYLDPGGIPVIRMGNIEDGKLIFENLKYFPKDWPELNKFQLQDGDVLFNRTNSAELVGKTAVYKKHHPKVVFASYLIRVKTNNDAYIPDLLAFFINSLYGRNYIASVVSQQVGQANVNGTKLSRMPIPLPSYYEQQKIVEEIECHFSVAGQIEQTIEQGLKQSDRLRQSILKRAFEGKLVPQDPADEPAWKLLERIKAEKEKLQTEQKKIKK